MNELELKRRIDLCAKKAEEMKNECDGSYTGAGERFIFESEGVKYEVTVEARWEKNDWFELDIDSEENEFKHTGHYSF